MHMPGIMNKKLICSSMDSWLDRCPVGALLMWDDDSYNMHFRPNVGLDRICFLEDALQRHGWWLPTDMH
jgi:hypothetical protein